MLNKSDYLRNVVINFSLRGVSPTAPANHYLALFNVAPTSAGGGTEVSGPGYVRKLVTFAAPVTPGAVSNTAQISQAPTGDWNSVEAVGVFDALTGGNMLYFGAITPRTVLSGDNFAFPVGYFAVAET